LTQGNPDAKAIQTVLLFILSPLLLQKNYLRMKIVARFFLLLFFWAFTHQMSAQTVAIGEMRPYLDTLSVDQKVELLNYMRYLGSSIDREVAQSYLQLDKSGQDRALQYIRLQLLKKQAGTDDRTTVRWAQDTIQVGQVGEGEVFTDSFMVTNTGAKPYIIKDVKATCDCTVMRRPTYPVMPGETAAIRVEFDTRGKIGRTTPGVVIYDNTRPNGRHIVYLNAEVVPRVKPKNNMGN